jgi:RimJ/RimL family protein N-acetyltransferase
VDLTQYSSTETLRDGRPVEIRALRPADRDELLTAIGRMSDQSIYRRFFSPKRHFADREVASYVDIDFVSHVALVAAVSENGHSAIIGGARFVVSRPGSAEVAFAVVDAYQGQGIGALLLKHLVALARQAGIEELVAEVLPHNTPMLKVFERSGLHASTRREDGVVHVSVRVT